MRKISTNHGFTLIELIVSIGLFSVVLFIGLTALLTMTASNSKAQATRKVVDNITFVLEDMTRSIRLGQNYHCESSVPSTPSSDIDKPLDCLLPDGGVYLAFEGLNGDATGVDKNKDQIVYLIEGNKIKKSTNGGVDFTEISSPDVFVDNLKFYVTGSVKTNSDGTLNLEQSRVLIVLQATAAKGRKEETKFNLQTMVSQRFNDF